MVGPVLLCLNMHFPLIPDLLLMSLVAVSPFYQLRLSLTPLLTGVCSV
jgi:hypothetical protein